MKSINLILFIISGLLIIACGEKTIDKETLKSYVIDEKNGLTVEEKFEDMIFQLQYRPAELIALEEGLKPIDKNFDKEVANLDVIQHFNLRIESPSKKDVMNNNVQSQIEWEERVKYFSLYADKDVKLVEGKDTLSCVLYHFERNYGIAPFCTMVIGFPQTKNKSEDKVLIFDDHQMDIGMMKFKISAKSIEEIPLLER